MCFWFTRIGGEVSAVIFGMGNKSEAAESLTIILSKEYASSTKKQTVSSMA